LFVGSIALTDQLTRDQEDEISIKDKKIIVKPAWKWLVEKKAD
jgi:hypothetical protein